MKRMNVSEAIHGDKWSREKVAAITAVFTGLTVGYASSYGSCATAFIIPLTQEFGWGRMVPSLMFLSSGMGLASASLWVGRVIDRFGEARVALVSTFGLAAVVAALGLLNGSPYQAFCLCFLIGLFGVGTNVGLYVSLLPKWFDRDLGRALGLSVIGQSLGVTVMPAIAASVIASTGWRSAYFVLAAIQLVVTLCVVAMLAWLGRRQREAPALALAVTRTGVDLPTALRTRNFWLLAITIFLVTVGTFGASIHIFPLYADRGAGAAALPGVAIALGLGTVAGRFGTGLLLDHLEARLVAAATFLVGAGSILWLAVLDNNPTLLNLLAPPMLLGLALGAETDLLAYMVRRFFGLLHYSAIYNRALIAYYLGLITGPTTLGWAFDHLAEPRLALFGLCGCCLAAAVLATRLPPSRVAPARRFSSAQG